jgi:hypothetical protein
MSRFKQAYIKGKCIVIKGHFCVMFGDFWRGGNFKMARGTLGFTLIERTGKLNGG